MDRSFVASSSLSSSSRLATTSKIGNKDDVVVGFDEDLMAIKARLCGESSKLQVIPIFGMGGIGKTTLARYAYEDQLSVEHFQIRAWVTFSQDYRLHEILSRLLVSLKLEKEDDRDESIDVRVYKSLKGRRYLIVMDDMWSTKAWDDVKRLFPDDNNGSRIILTTRLSDVANYADSSSSLHEMHFMDEDQSWDLLRNKVFKREHSCSPELENIGRRIAESCRGLPLAIVVIAGILTTVSQTKASWKKVEEKVTTLVVTTSDEHFANILSLSYTHLPHQLRACFLYLGRFPEDYEIYASKLTKLWVAEGFITEPSDRVESKSSFEESAEDYLEDLVKRSLVLVTSRKYNGKIKGCSLHDLVRDLCIRKSNEDQHWAHIPTTRTILCFPGGRGISSSLKKFRFLTVFDALVVKFREFPTEVLGLIFLTYLAFSFFCLRNRQNFDVPSSISKLQNLQTLFITGYSNRDEESIRVRFPLEIFRMPQLRHLVSSQLDPLLNPRTDKSLSFVLKNLQTLAVVLNFRCTEKILQTIPNLRKLKIAYERLIDKKWPDYQLNNLVHLHRLQILSITVRNSWKCRFPSCENLVFPVMLRKLSLSGFLFQSRDMEIVVGLLPNLEVLKLGNCSFEGGKWETSEGGFTRLRVLQLVRVHLEECRDGARGGLGGATATPLL